MKLLSTALCLTLLLCSDAQSQTPVTSADCDTVETDAGVALDLINKDRRDGYIFTLFRVADAHEQQTVIFYLTLDVLETQCSVLSRRHWEACKLPQHNEMASKSISPYSFIAFSLFVCVCVCDMNIVDDYLHWFGYGKCDRPPFHHHPRSREHHHHIFSGKGHPPVGPSHRHHHHHPGFGPGHPKRYYHRCPPPPENRILHPEGSEHHHNFSEEEHQHGPPHLPSSGPHYPPPPPGTPHHRHHHPSFAPGHARRDYHRCPPPENRVLHPEISEHHHNFSGEEYQHGPPHLPPPPGHISSKTPHPFHKRQVGSIHHIPVLNQHDVLPAPAANFPDPPPASRDPFCKYLSEKPAIQPFPQAPSESKSCPGKPKYDLPDLLPLFPHRSTQ
uniref:Histidine-rich glycoprotein n=1 Tax=Gopherus agassizii TaxID=38772 RepID=A0A452IFL7_9SAUR